LIPHLEVLENRSAAASLAFDMLEYPAPPNMTSALAVQVDTDVLLFLGQFPQLHFGIPYVGPNEVIRWDITQSQWEAILGTGQPLSVAREVCWVFGGDVPCFLVPPGVGVSPGDQTAAGLLWEESCLAQGWWFSDPPGVNQASLIPPGPQGGEQFEEPDFFLADALFVSDELQCWILL
jgi:hypothetical protein